MEPETALIAKARDGHHDAFLDLLSRYDRQIMSVVYRFTADQFDREDLYQEIFLHAFRSLRGYRGQAAFSTWLTRLALNRCITYMKKNKPTQTQENAHQEPSDIPPNLEIRERLSAIHRALTKLRGPQHISFHLYYIEDWSLPNIAQLLGCGEGAVKSHLNRARKKIRGDREVLQWQTNP